MTKPISIRLDQDLRPRIDALLTRMSIKADGVKIEFSSVLRHVLLRGLKAIEQDQEMAFGYRDAWGTAGSIPDLWVECFPSKAPWRNNGQTDEQLSNLFCQVCRNTGCSRSSTNKQ